MKTNLLFVLCENKISDFKRKIRTWTKIRTLDLQTSSLVRILVQVQIFLLKSEIVISQGTHLFPLNNLNLKICIDIMKSS